MKEIIFGEEIESRGGGSYDFEKKNFDLKYTNMMLFTLYNIINKINKELHCF